MEEMFEYLLPLQGFFKKKRDPKIIESYKKLSDFTKIVEDFKTARAFFNDEFRVGDYCIFRKEKTTIFYLKDIKAACFRIHGYDSTDEYSTINLIFADNSEEVIHKSYQTDMHELTDELFAFLKEKGIETIVIETR